MESSFPGVAAADIYARRPTGRRNFLPATCAVDSHFVSEQRRIVAKGPQLLFRENVTLDLAISAGVSRFADALSSLPDEP